MALTNLNGGGGVCDEKIVGYSFIEPIPYDSNIFQRKSDELLNGLVHNEKFETLFSIPKKKFYICGMNESEDYKIIEADFVREQTLVLLSREIRRKNVEGCVAELGVFRGDFSKKINKLFPEKQLFLFDTFEGFDKRNVDNDETLSWEKLDAFNITSVEEVLNKMEYPDNCIIKKGFFPETFDLFDMAFSFVSIDVDLYDPIKSGLEIFYPLLSKGGYIMLHDYNTIVYKGTKKAVQEYCDCRNISYVPIPDIAGSIIITK